MLSRLEFLTTKAPSLFYNERHVQYQLVLMVTMLTSCLSIFSALARDNVGKNQLKNNNKYYTHVQVQWLSSHVQCTLLSTCTHVLTTYMCISQSLCTKFYIANFQILIYKVYTLFLPIC